MTEGIRQRDRRANTGRTGADNNDGSIETQVKPIIRPRWVDLLDLKKHGDRVNTRREQSLYSSDISTGTAKTGAAESSVA